MWLLTCRFILTETCYVSKVFLVCFLVHYSTLHLTLSLDFHHYVKWWNGTHDPDTVHFILVDLNLWPIFHSSTEDMADLPTWLWGSFSAEVGLWQGTRGSMVAALLLSSGWQSGLCGGANGAGGGINSDSSEAEKYRGDRMWVQIHSFVFLIPFLHWTQQTFLLLSGLRLQLQVRLLLCFCFQLWLRRRSLVLFFSRLSWLGCLLNWRLVRIVWTGVQGLWGGCALFLWGRSLAVLLLPFTELLLEPAVVFMDVAPEDRWQGVHSVQHLARLIIGVVWVDVEWMSSEA